MPSQAHADPNGAGYAVAGRNSVWWRMTAQALLRWPRAVDANPWLKALLARRPRLVVAVALANKLARIVWAVMRHGTEFRPAAA